MAVLVITLLISIAVWKLVEIPITLWWHSCFENNVASDLEMSRTDSTVQRAIPSGDRKSINSWSG